MELLAILHSNSVHELIQDRLNLLVFFLPCQTRALLRHLSLQEKQEFEAVQFNVRVTFN